MDLHGERESEETEEKEKVKRHRYDSVRRVDEVYKAKGFHTKY